jgi:broad specificity phosphatase PhoE
MIRVVLARHGVTEWNQANRYQGHQDVPLSDLGRQQAARLGERLRSEAISAAYTSDLARARDTAAIALEGRGVPLVATPALREINFGAWEGLGHRDIAERFPEAWSAWTRDPAATRPPGGGESLADLHQRVVGFFRSALEQIEPALAWGLGVGGWGLDREGPAQGQSAIRNPQSAIHRGADRFLYRAAGGAAGKAPPTLLLVTHGGALRVLLTHLLEMPVVLYWRLGARPASVTVLEVYPEGAIAEVIGDTSHLTPGRRGES